MSREPGFAPTDRLLAVTTLSFDISVLELFLPLTVGGTVVIADQEDTGDASRLAERLERKQISVMQATPATWQMMIEAGWSGTERLKVLCGGEALLPDLAAALLDRSDDVWNLYGPTEATFTRKNLEIAFGGVLRQITLGGATLHDDEDARAVTIFTDDERPFVQYGDKTQVADQKQ